MPGRFNRVLALLGVGALALTLPVLAQGPESILPEGFGTPQPAPRAPATPAPAATPAPSMVAAEAPAPAPAEAKAPATAAAPTFTPAADPDLPAGVEMVEMTVRQALNEAMAEEMRRDPDILLMGEEVAEYNGAYKVSQGLLDEFGAKRVVDTPITEHAFAGIGIGALRRLEQLIQEVVVTVPRALIAETINLVAVLSGRGSARRLAELARVEGLGPDGDYRITPAIQTSTGESS